MTVRQVMNEIRNNFNEYFEDDAIDIRLEEMRASSSEEYDLTISFLIPDKTPKQKTEILLNALEGLRGSQDKYIRRYKRLRVNRNSAEITSILNHDNA